MQKDRDHCYICGRNGNGDPLEEHHCIGGNPGRKLSEQDGLKIYICGNRCHRNGQHSVHRSKEVRSYIQRIAQEEWERTYGNRTDFMKRYGKNYCT